MSTQVKLAWFYLLLSIVGSCVYFWSHWQASRELYWSIVALLNKRLSLLVILNVLVAGYVAVVMSVHQYVFGSVRESERYVGLFLTQGNSSQVQIQDFDTFGYLDIYVYVVRLHPSSLCDIFHDWMGLCMVLKFI